MEIFEDLFPHLFRQTCKLAIVNITPVRFGNGSSGGHIFSKMTIKIKINIFGSFQNSSMVKLARLRENDIKSHLLRLPTINCLKLLSDIIFPKHLAAQNLRRERSFKRAIFSPSKKKRHSFKTPYLIQLSLCGYAQFHSASHIIHYTGLDVDKLEFNSSYWKECIFLRDLSSKQRD